MSTSVFPTLAGQGWSVKRKPEWRTRINENVSGREVRQTDWSYPRYVWDLTFNVLRQGTVHGTVYSELTQLFGFFNSRQGRFDSFLYQDNTDNTVVGQALGVGNGVQTQFQLIRSFGGFVEPIFAPNVVSAAKVNGVDPGGWSVSNWGSVTPGIVTFAAPPGNGLAVTADFTYYFPVRFVDDELNFENFLAALWELKGVQFRSIK